MMKSKEEEHHRKQETIMTSRSTSLARDGRKRKKRKGKRKAKLRKPYPHHRVILVVRLR